MVERLKVRKNEEDIIPIHESGNTSGSRRKKSGGESGQGGSGVPIREELGRPIDTNFLDREAETADEEKRLNKKGYKTEYVTGDNTPSGELDPLERLIAEEMCLNPDDLDSTPGEIQLNDQQLSELRSVVGRTRIRNKLFQLGHDKEDVDVMMQNIERYLDKKDDLSERGDPRKTQRHHFVKKEDGKNIIERSEHSKELQEKYQKNYEKGRRSFSSRKAA